MRFARDQEISGVGVALLKMVTLLQAKDQDEG
jgi:hypothetical protein